MKANLGMYYCESTVEASEVRVNFSTVLPYFDQNQSSKILDFWYRNFCIPLKEKSGGAHMMFLTTFAESISGYKKKAA